jgi:hypothetical protein
MTHNHGYEYQIRVILRDRAEELSGWMNSTEQVAQMIIMVHKLRSKTCWLLVRNAISPSCSEREQVLEYPLMDIPSPRCIPYDSRHLRAADSKTRYALNHA